MVALGEKNSEACVGLTPAELGRARAPLTYLLRYLGRSGPLSKSDWVGQDALVDEKGLHRAVYLAGSTVRTRATVWQHRSKQPDRNRRSLWFSTTAPRPPRLLQVSLVWGMV